MAHMHDGAVSTPNRCLEDAWARLTHAEVDWILEAAEIPRLFVKGPTIADWLYEPGERSFVDVDVLVPPDLLDAALVQLRRRDYVDTIAGTAHGEAAPHSHPLRRAD